MSIVTGSHLPTHSASTSKYLVRVNFAWFSLSNEASNIFKLIASVVGVGFVGSSVPEIFEHPKFIAIKLSQLSALILGNLKDVG